LEVNKIREHNVLFSKIRSTELCVTFYIQHIYTKPDLKYGNSAILKKGEGVGEAYEVPDSLKLIRF
jgi:hypothetical protein